MRATANIERWPLARPFTIARGTKHTADVVVASVGNGAVEGRSECVPYPRYGHSPAAVADAINGFQGTLDRHALLEALPAGPVRNALDCALWDFEAKAAGKPAWAFAGLPPPTPVTTAYTIVLDTVEAMGTQARTERERGLLKVKLGSDDADADAARLAAVRRHAPNARIIVDANEGWTLGALQHVIPHAATADVQLIEQPLPARADRELAGLDSPVPIAADESVGDGADLDALAQRYQAINVKLDNAGGLTRALALAREARERGLVVMVGCMVATSLAMAPALLLTPFAEFVDLDGPLLLAEDRNPGLAYNGDSVEYKQDVWG